MRDLMSPKKVVQLYQGAVTTNGGVLTGYVDTQGFDSLTILASYGAITSTTAVFTATLRHSDATTTAGFTTTLGLVTTPLVNGSIGLGAGTRTDGTGDKVVRKAGYNGTKRYVRAHLKPSASSTAGVVVSVIGILENASRVPQDNLGIAP